jgi:hypothetical protein
LPAESSAVNTSFTLESVLSEHTVAASFLFTSQLLCFGSHLSLAISGTPTAGKIVAPTWVSETVTSVTSVCLVNWNCTDSGSSCANSKHHVFVCSKSNKSQYIVQ